MSFDKTKPLHDALEIIRACTDVSIIRTNTRLREVLDEAVEDMRLHNLDLAYSDARSGYLNSEIDLMYKLREMFLDVAPPPTHKRDGGYNHDRYTVSPGEEERAMRERQARRALRVEREELRARLAELDELDL